MKQLNTEDYRNTHCGNCDSYLHDSDKYCRYCGTKRGEGRFKANLNPQYDLYGPPIETRFKCKKCGNTWTSHALGVNNDKFCPECGTKHIESLAEKIADWFGSINLE